MAPTQCIGNNPLQAGRIAGLWPRFLLFAYRMATDRFAVGVFIALCVTLLSCLGPVVQTATATQPANTSPQENQDWAPARLAREKPLEIVIIKPVGSCPEGFRSRFDSNLANQQGPDFRPVCSEASELLVYPRIWSGSEGTDLVIKTQRACVPIAILIDDTNDEPGYIEFDARSRSPRIRSTRTPVGNKQKAFIVRARRTHRSIIDVAAGCRFCGVAVLGRSPPPSPAEFQEVDTKKSQTRAPPSILPSIDEVASK